jgi:hypothetical protein
MTLTREELIAIAAVAEAAIYGSPDYEHCLEVGQRNVDGLSLAWLDVIGGTKPAALVKPLEPHPSGLSPAAVAAYGPAAAALTAMRQSRSNVAQETARHVAAAIETVHDAWRPTHKLTIKPAAAGAFRSVALRVMAREAPPGVAGCCLWERDEWESPGRRDDSLSRYRSDGFGCLTLHGRPLGARRATLVPLMLQEERTT